MLSSSRDVLFVLYIILLYLSPAHAHPRSGNGRPTRFMGRNRVKWTRVKKKNCQQRQVVAHVMHTQNMSIINSCVDESCLYNIIIYVIIFAYYSGFILYNTTSMVYRNVYNSEVIRLISYSRIPPVNRSECFFKFIFGIVFSWHRDVQDNIISSKWFTINSIVLKYIDVLCIIILYRDLGITCFQTRIEAQHRSSKL